MPATDYGPLRYDERKRMPRTKWPGIYSREARTGRVYDAMATHNYRQRMKRGFTTISDAKHWQAETLEDMRAGRMGTAPARLTFSKFFNETWLPGKEPSLRPSSIKNYRNLGKRATVLLGDKRLTSLSSLDIQQALTSLAQERLSSQSRRLFYNLMHQCLEDARKWHLIRINPCKDMDPPKAENREAMQLNHVAIRGLLEAASQIDTANRERDKPTHWHFVIYFAIATGMRRGELASLKWTDIDFAQSTLFIPRGKTKSSVRVVVIDPGTLEKLQAHRYEQLAEWGNKEHAFLGTEGNDLTHSNFFMSTWQAITLAAGLPGLHFHDLRHLNTTAQARAGVPMSVASKRLGHSNIGITDRIYTHVDLDDQRAAAELIGSWLKELG